ncbi:hypothetical protein BD770DRAFT_398606 [Pilaira anomala]|nr:hypothetical protein BD770DRAFT_398606 [Pilaira anomala]
MTKIQLAESFLKSDIVQNKPIQKKVDFLKTKGLNDEEIQEAFKKTDTSSDKTPPPPLPPRPKHLIYYHQTSPIRMTNKQLCTYVIMTVLSTLGITVIMTLIIKKIMSKIFNSIVRFQSNRYQKTTQIFQDIDTSLQTQPNNIPQLHEEQVRLNDTLYRLIELAQNLKQDREKSIYIGFRSGVNGLRDTILRQPLLRSNMYGGTSSHINIYHDARIEEQDRIIQEIKSDIRNVKGMLLSRKNFPVVSSGIHQSSTLPPAVPKEQPPLIYHPRRKRSFRSELKKT